MELRIKNIGKIKNVNIVLDGITVLAGENDTGKSTVGKALYCMFNAGYKLEKKIGKGREASLERTLNLIIRENYAGYKINDIENFINRLSSFDIDNITEDDAEELSFFISEFEPTYAFNRKDKIFKGLVLDDVRKLCIEYRRIMGISITELVEVIVNSNLKREFHDTINNIYYKETGSIEIVSKSFDIKARVEDNKVIECDMIPLFSSPIYIDDPFALDSINNFNILHRMKQRMAFMGHQMDLRYKMTTIDNVPDIESLMLEIVNNKILEKVWKYFESIKIGNIQINNSNNQSYYVLHDEDIKLNIDSVSTGIKSFAILKQLLLSGLLKKKGILILDEPEVHLHPKWQILYAEIIVLLQKYYELNILINTHSPYFLRAIEVYSSKYNVETRCKYYLTSLADNGFDAVMSDVTGDVNCIYEVLARPFELLQQEVFADD